MANLADKSGQIQSWEDIFDIIISIAKRQTLVATLAYVEEVKTAFDLSKGFGIVTVKPFPLVENQTEYNIDVYYTEPKLDIIKEKGTDGKYTVEYREYKKGDIVKILFCDYDFRSNIQNNQKKPIKVSATENHSKSYGIIIS